MHILHVIIDLNVGGAELMLLRLIQSSQSNPKFSHSVISLTDIGKVGQQLEASGVDVVALNMTSIFDVLRVLNKLFKIIKLRQPQIIQTWMYHADLLGGMAARLAGKRNIIWGIRGTSIPQRGLSTTRLVVSLCSLLSHWIPALIVCCAKSARNAHSVLGYDQRKMTVINNGYDLKPFNISPQAREQSRVSFGFNKNDIVVGTVGRFDPLKDYGNFIRAASEVVRCNRNAKFLMVGRGLNTNNDILQQWIEKTGLKDRFVLAGEREDIPYCLACLDIFCLSSISEGFPNVVCEAMASGVPCVVTNVGDAAGIVADTGIVVAPGDSVALADALMSLLGKDECERSELGTLARKRIEAHYSIECATANFEAWYAHLVSGVPLNV